MPAIHSTVTELFTDIADAIRSKTGDVGEIRAEAFPSAILALPQGSVTPSGKLTINTDGTYDVTSYFSVTISTSENNLFYGRVVTGLSQAMLEDSEMTSVASGAFAETAIKAFSFPNCTEVGRAAFWGASASQIYLSNLVSIGESAFTAANLVEANYPNAYNLSPYAFYNCSSLSTVSLKTNQTQDFVIPKSAFAYCSALETLNIKPPINIQESAFYNCKKLTSIDLTACQEVSSSAFYQCETLKSLTFNNISYIYSGAFRYCYSLNTVIINTNNITTTIGPSAFQNCYNLLSFYLLGSNLAILSTITAFNSTPISNYTTSTGGVNGSIYVPASLYSSYIAATNWVSYSSRFVSLTSTQIANLFN